MSPEASERSGSLLLIRSITGRRGSPVVQNWTSGRWREKAGFLRENTNRCDRAPRRPDQPRHALAPGDFVHGIFSKHAPDLRPHPGSNGSIFARAWAHRLSKIGLAPGGRKPVFRPPSFPIEGRCLVIRLPAAFSRKPRSLPQNARRRFCRKWDTRLQRMSL